MELLKCRKDQAKSEASSKNMTFNLKENMLDSEAGTEASCEEFHRHMNKINDRWTLRMIELKSKSGEESAE